MTSKTLSVKLLKESIKRNMAFGALLTLIFFCYFPVGGMLYLRSLDPDFTLVKLEELYTYGGNNPVLFMITFASAALMGILQFSYLHSREKVDFYHSFPVRREKIFGIQYLAGVIIWFIPYAVNNVFYLVLCLGKGAGGIGVKTAESVAAHLVCFMLVYGCMILAMMLTGKIFVAIAGMMVISVYIPGIRLLADGLMSIHFATYSGMMEFFQGGTVMKLSPVSVYYLIVRDMMQTEGYVFPKELLLAVLLTALLIAVICFCIYKRRNSESAGNSMAFMMAARVIKFLIMVPCVLLCYVFFWGMSDGSTLWGVFGLVFGLIIFSGLIEFIYTLDIREIFRDKGQILFTAVICLAVMAEFWFDLTGFDKWIPAEKEVASAEISMGGMPVNTYQLIYSEYGTGESAQYVCEYLREKENIEIGEDQIGLVIDLVKNTGEMAGFEETADKDGGIYQSGQNYQYYIDKENDIYRLGLEVTWNLKNGKTEIRSYSLSKRMWKEYFGKIWELPGVKEAYCPVLNVNTEDILAVIKDKNDFNYSVEEAYGSEGEEEKFSGDTGELMETLEEEIRNQEIEEPYKEYENTLTVIYRDTDGVIYGEIINLTDDFPKTEALLSKNVS
ncbi:MAG: hypothetical protein Q4F83_00640 [Eubacteriales bacterium]|nr:hypothetical protein [Eubacteriales bacterium]